MAQQRGAETVHPVVVLGASAELGAARVRSRKVNLGRLAAAELPVRAGRAGAPLELGRRPAVAAITTTTATCLPEGQLVVAGGSAGLVEVAS
jgi:hypothetical protein